MGYYEEKQKANQYLDNIFKNALKSKSELSYSKIILDTTNIFKVGENSVKKRVQLLLQEYDGLELDDNTIKRKR